MTSNPQPNESVPAPAVAPAPPLLSRKQVMDQLAERLTGQGHVSNDRMEEILHRVKWLGEPLDWIIRREALVDEDVLLALLSDLAGVPVMRMIHTAIEPEAVRLVPARVATHYHIMPLSESSGTLIVAADRVFDVKEQDKLGILLGRAIAWRLARAREIDACIKQYYGVGIEALVGLRATSGVGGRPSDAAVETGAGGTDTDDHGVIAEFIHQVIRDAVKTNASDIHLEPTAQGLRLRYRIDGVLYRIPLPHGIERYQKAIVSSTKVMAQLNIAERRLPQDGRFTLAIDDEDLDIRVSVLPAHHGESINLRILNRKATFLTLREIGLRARERTAVEELTSHPNGAIFFTGATGSGKTTSLYAVLANLNIEERNIVTVEDPVEYQVEGITQLQVQPTIGFTFAAGLRSILRHDPDIVLVGEIRDRETAEIAISAALTGHLVLSTLHTNDAIGAIARLLDMGVEPYLVASSTRGIVAQRLIRRICPSCRETATIDDVTLERLRRAFPEIPADTVFYRGRGCPDCRFTGYLGRRAVFEALVITDEIRSLIVQRASGETILQLAMSQGLVPLRRGGWQCAVEGLTTVDEVLRVTRRRRIGARRDEIAED